MSGGVPAGELLPCPFCGTAAEILENLSEKHGVEHTDRYFVRCSPCDLIIDSAWDVPYDQAVTAWNTRATPTPPIEGRDADVERVARALCERNVPGTAGDTVGWIERQWQFYVPDARAALQALGERP